MKINLECISSTFGVHGGFTVHQYESGADTFHTNACIQLIDCIWDMVNQGKQRI